MSSKVKAVPVRSIASAAAEALLERDRCYLLDSSALKVGFPLDWAARILPIVSAIAVSVIVEPNRIIFFSNGRAK